MCIETFCFWGTVACIIWLMGGTFFLVVYLRRHR